MGITVTSKKMYSGKAPTEGEIKDGVEYVPRGTRKASDLVDKQIEDHVTRVELPRDKGNISITVLPGDHLGQFSANVQFEGKSGEHELCLQEQDTLLQFTADWLREILSDFGCDFSARIEAVPCESAKARLQIGLAAKRLMGHEVEERRHIDPGPVIPIENSREVGG